MAWDDFLKAEAWRNSMANLLKRGQESVDYINQAPSKAGQAILDAGQRQQALMNKAFDPTGKTLIRNPQAANQAAMNLLEGPLGFMPAGITAWHGSPHTFDKFDMSKVGTGEGAQAYGHGMYFAEAPDVARTYATSGKYESANDYAQHFLAENKGNKDLALKALNNEVAHFDKNGWTADISKDMVKDIEKSIKNGVQGSNLYKVDIPDEHIPMMLDWDKPLLQQPKEVIEKLKKLNDPYITEAITTQPKLSKDGEYWTYMGNTYGSKSEALEDATAHRLVTGYTNLGKTPQEVSKTLNEAGIKGIKYLDQNSRGTGGTSNFVVFDPTDVKILERNNQPVSRKEILEEQVNKLK